MNILLSMPDDGQSNNYIINTLQMLGHNVTFVDHRNNLNNCKRLVPFLIADRGIEMFLCLYLNEDRTYDEDYIKKLKEAYPQCKYCAWIFDTTIEGKYCDENERFINLVKAYDFFFTVCRGQVESFRDQGVNAFFIPEGASPYTYDLTNTFPEIFDVSFIGQIGHPEVHNERLPLLEVISEEIQKLIVYGRIDGKAHSYLMEKESDLLRQHVLRPTYNDVEHSKVVAHSKINLCHSGWPHIEGYFSARNYRVMASGGFVLANHSNNIESFFEIGKEIAVYEDTADCLEKIKYYLENEEERYAIAEAGKAKVVKNYTFLNSFEKIFKWVNNV